LQPKRRIDISVEDVEESSPVLRQPFRRGKHPKPDAPLFEDVFKDSPPPSDHSKVDGPNR
jgi:hypothetical protein